MTAFFIDLQNNERFSVGGINYIKGPHPAYQSHNRDELPPNAHRPRAPYLYVRFEPTTPVVRAIAFHNLQDGEPFSSGGMKYVKGQHPDYQLTDPNEPPPNAYRPDAPQLYVRFGLDALVN